MSRAQLELLEPEQLERYEFYRRSVVPAGAVKEILKNFFSDESLSGGLECDKNDEMTVVMLQGLAKLYVGSLVETARATMTRRGESGPILPHHYREAFAQLRAVRSTEQESTGIAGATTAAPKRRLLGGAPQFGPPDGCFL